VIEYTTRFTNLLRNAPSYVVNSEKEKLYYYCKGLNPHIKLKFGGIESNTLRALVDRCIQIEKDRDEAGEEYKERKRKPKESLRGRDHKRIRRDAPSRERSHHNRDDNPGSSTEVEATSPNTPTLLRIVTPKTVMHQTATPMIVSTIPAL
jgi:hypothetical protein